MTDIQICSIARLRASKHAMRRFFVTAGTALTMMLAACGNSPESKATPGSNEVTAQQNVTPFKGHATPALWVVKDADTTIYMFGTVHLLTPDIQWFDGYVKSAFDKSGELALEVIEPDADKMNSIVTQLAVNTQGPPLSQRLSGKQKDAYLKALADNKLPAAAMDYLDPWMVAITLSVAPLERLGYDQNIGVEKTLEKTARDEGKEVVGLETVEQQLGYFDTLPDAAQINYLNTTVAEMGQIESEFNQLLHNWAEGKPDALAAQMNASLESTPELAQALLFNRNARWAEWISKRLEKPGTVFLAVGAGHLAGKGSVIDLLDKKHLKVTRLSSTADTQK